VPVAGPIGAVLAPALVGTPAAKTLPYASSLCGSCTAVCPVRIDLHEQLLAWRREAPALPASLRRGARLGAWVMERPRLYCVATRAMRTLWPLLARPFFGNPATPWLASRELPEHPGASFAERWRRTRGARQ
jgi:L-lactate dehydrogenase complex protein LldF